MYYVIQVQSGKEKKTIHDIKMHMKDLSFFDVFTPYRRVIRRRNGENHEELERCFPGYIFVETDNIQKLFKDLYWVPDFTKILGREELTYNFVPLNEEESRMIDILYNPKSNRVTEISNVEINEGDDIIILDGPLMGLKSKVLKINLHKRYALISLTLCNQQMTTKVGINIISRANSEH